MLIEPYAGGERARIASANISEIVGRWDLILGRVRPDVMELWGPCRCFAASDETGIQATLERVAGELGVDAGEVDEIVRRAPREFVDYRAPEPVTVTTEGDPVVLVTARWSAPRARAASALGRAKFLIADPDGDEPGYDWLGSRDQLTALQPEALPAGALTIDSSPLSAPDAIVLGRFTVAGDEIRYEGLSERRLGWAIDIMANLVPRAKVIEVTTKDIAEALAEQPEGERERTEIPAEALAEVRAMSTERWLREPVPALGGLTPREAAGSAAAIPKLRALLRTMESHAARAPDDFVMDVEAITRELGVTA